MIGLSASPAIDRRLTSRVPGSTRPTSFKRHSARSSKFFSDVIIAPRDDCLGETCMVGGQGFTCDWAVIARSDDDYTPE
jgi:hypothetical protein